jgi:hypothetical protein
MVMGKEGRGQERGRIYLFGLSVGQKLNLSNFLGE